MRLCNVVDTSITEDKEYLEFWYADTVYARKTANYIYMKWKKYLLKTGYMKTQDTIASMYLSQLKRINYETLTYNR